MHKYLLFLVSVVFLSGCSENNSADKQPDIVCTNASAGAEELQIFPEHFQVVKMGEIVKN
jgi:hypothetical protein